MSETNDYRALSNEEQMIWSDVFVLLASHLPIDAPASAETDFAIQRLRARERQWERTSTFHERRLWALAYASTLIQFPDVDTQVRGVAEKYADGAVKTMRARGLAKTEGRAQLDFAGLDDDLRAVIPTKAENEQPNRHQCNATRDLDRYRRQARELLPPTDADRDDIEEALTRLRPPRYSAEEARLFLRSEILEYPQNHAAAREGLYWRVMSILAQVGDVDADGRLFPLKTGRDVHMGRVSDPLGKPTEDFVRDLVNEALARLEGL